MEGGKNRGAGGGGGGNMEVKKKGGAGRRQGNTEREREREREAAMKDADVISVKQPIREQQGGKKGGRRGRAQKGVFYVPLQHQCKKKRRERRKDTTQWTGRRK